MRHQLGLDKPVLLQFIDYLKGIVHADFGISLKSNRPFLKDIINYFPATIELAIAYMIFAVVSGKLNHTKIRMCLYLN